MGLFGSGGSGGIGGTISSLSNMISGKASSTVGSLAYLFGGGRDEMTSGSQIAMDEYKKYMEDALSSIGQHETQGRSDLEKYLASSQEYGSPYRQAGNAGLKAYMGSMGLGGAAEKQSALEAFQTSPSYQFALNQGLQQQQRQAAASGQRGSGAEQKALTQYATNLANTEYNQWQQGLMGLTNMGAQANEQAANRAYGTGGSLSNLGQEYSKQTSGVYSDMAQAMAEMQMQKAAAAAQGKSEKTSAWGGLAGGLF